MDSHHITHGESIWERLDVLRDKGSHGAKTCVAMGAFLKERASVENAYGQVREHVGTIDKNASHAAWVEPQLSSC